jgi:hypothetical protein
MRDSNLEQVSLKVFSIEIETCRTEINDRFLHTIFAKIARSLRSLKNDERTKRQTKTRAYRQVPVSGAEFVEKAFSQILGPVCLPIPASGRGAE